MKEIIEQINKTFELREDLLQEVKNENNLLVLVSQYVQELINKDFEHLLYLLYKIDIGENKVKKAILESSVDEAHLIIAKMILEREKEKIKTRKKYNTKSENNDWIF